MAGAPIEATPAPLAGAKPGTRFPVSAASPESEAAATWLPAIQLLERRRQPDRLSLGADHDRVEEAAVPCQRVDEIGHRVLVDPPALGREGVDGLHVAALRGDGGFHPDGGVHIRQSRSMLFRVAAS
jgi:hypothetical protein